MKKIVIFAIVAAIGMAAFSSCVGCGGPRNTVGQAPQEIGLDND